jgi:hypothetical protein
MMFTLHHSVVIDCACHPFSLADYCWLLVPFNCPLPEFSQNWCAPDEAAQCFLRLFAFPLQPLVWHLNANNLNGNSWGKNMEKSQVEDGRGKSVEAAL